MKHPVNMLVMLMPLIFSMLIHCAKPSSQNYQTYLWAHFNHLNNHDDIAKECYKILLQEKPHSSVYEGYAHHLFQTEQYTALVAITPLLEKHVPNNLDTQLLCAQALELVGKRPEATKKLVALSNQFPTNPEVVYYAAAAQVQSNQNDAALKLIDAYLANTTENAKQFIFYFLKAQIYSAIGNKEAALENVKKSLELNAHFDQGWLLFGLIHELSGELDDALKGYNQCLNIMGGNELLERQIIQLQLRKQQQQLTDTSQAQYAKALELFNKNNYKEALVFVDATLKKGKHTPSRLLKVEILCRTGNVPQAIALLQEWALTDEHNDTWYRALHVLYQAGAPANAILKAYAALEKHNAKNWLPYAYQADVYLKTHQMQQAKNYLNKTIEFCKDPKVRTRTLFQLALIAYQEQEWQSLEKILNTAYDLNHDFLPLLNLSAYYHATQTKQFDKAQELIEKALAKDPRNPHFLDTQATIWHKKKEFKKAYDTLVVIAQHVPQDSIIQYHLAKAAYHVGEIALAKTCVEKAITLSNNHHDKERYKNSLQAWNAQK